MKALFDLHTHTLASGHAFSTLKENIEEAKRKALWAVGTSDHTEKMPGSNPNVFINYKVVQNVVEGVHVFCGMEANICDYEGTLDVKEPLLQKMDYVLASLHSPCILSGTVEQNTAALIGAMKNPYVKVIAHPDDSRYPVDYEVFITAAKRFGVVPELNNSSLQADSTRINGRENAKKLLMTCKKHSVPVILGSDAHIWYDVGRFDEAYALLEETAFPEELILNLRADGVRAVLNAVCLQKMN